MENQEKPVVDQQKAEKLDEADFWKLRLLNRNVDFFTLQIDTAQLQLMEASRTLMAFSNDLATRYGLVDHRQVDVHTGAIERDPEKLGGARESDDGK